jgi:polyisoprenoid-binding protein YceI
MTLELDPANTRIEFTLAATLHTMRGTFALKSGIIHFNPSNGAAGGLVVVDATSGDTGNTGRDRKMHQEILESQRYPEITFTPTRMSSKVEPEGDSKVQVDGIVRLHGSDHGNDSDSSPANERKRVGNFLPHRSMVLEHLQAKY